MVALPTPAPPPLGCKRHVLLHTRALTSTGSPRVSHSSIRFAAMGPSGQRVEPTSLAFIQIAMIKLMKRCLARYGHS